MRKVCLLFFVSFILLSGKAISQSPQFAWAKRIGGSSNDRGKAITTDGSGNVYVTGFFMGTVDFDPGAGTTNLTAAGNADAFIAKFDASENLVWAKKVGGSTHDEGKSIAVDASGNVYVTGYFYGSGDFDPGAGTNNLASAGGYDAFVLKLDPSGNHVWAKKIGGAEYEEAFSIAVDASNVYITGSFSTTVDFDPDAGGTSNLSTTGGRDAFILKLDASGSFVWAKNVGGSSTDQGNAIAVDASGNIYISGEFQSTADFDPGTGKSDLTSAGNADAFILKLDAMGDFVWSRKVGGSSNDNAYSLALDGSGNVLVCGYFEGTVDFDPGAATSNIISAGGKDGYVLKLTTSGNYQWAINIGTSDDNECQSVALDASGNIYVTGYTNGTVEVDPDFGSFVTGYSVLIAKVSSSGSIDWSQSLGSSGFDQGCGIAVDASANVYVTGYFDGTVDFDAGTGTSNLTATSGSTDAFVLKLLATNITLPLRLNNFKGSLVNEKAHLSWQTSMELNTEHFELQRSSNGATYVTVATIAAAGNSNSVIDYRYTDPQSFVGTVYYRLKMNDKDGSTTYSAIISLKNTHVTSSFLVYPNPVSKNALLQMSLSATMPLHIRIIDQAGRVVINKIVLSKEGNNTIELPTGRLTRGVYFITVEGNTIKKQLQLVKQ